MAAITAYLRFERYLMARDGSPIVSRTMRTEPVDTSTVVPETGDLRRFMFDVLSKIWQQHLPQFTLVEASTDLLNVASDDKMI